MTGARPGDTVKVHYTGTLVDGTVFDSSVGREPIEFTIGEHDVIRGFEDAVVGLSVGERKQVTVAPGEGYGERNEDKVMVVDRAHLPPDFDPKPGMMVQSTLPDGPVVLVITDVGEDQVTLDANHPLAGQQLMFELELTDLSRP